MADGISAQGQYGRNLVRWIRTIPCKVERTLATRRLSRWLTVRVTIPTIVQEPFLPFPIAETMATIEEDLSQIEKDIRTLKIEYEQYFGGGRKRPPSDTQWRVESLMKRYGDRGAEMNYAQRFRYTNLSQTFAKYCEIWRKKLKEREEGGQRHFGAAAKAIEAERAKGETADPSASTDQAAFAMNFSDPEREAGKVEQLYRKLVEARTATGEKGGTPNFEEFSKFVRSKTQQLKSKNTKSQVEYTVSVESGRVKLKARLSS